MSAFVLVLMAGMAVGSGPRPVSAKVEQRLELRGNWVGTAQTAGGQFSLARLNEDYLCAEDPVFCLFYPSEITDEGLGKFRSTVDDVIYHGIYEQDGDRLVLCYREPDHGRPVSFCPGSGQYLLILHRVKPRK